MTENTQTPAAEPETPAVDAISQAIDSQVQNGPDVAAAHSYGPAYTCCVTLQKPLKRDSAEMAALDVIYLREPKAGDLRGVKLADLLTMDTAALLPLLGRIAMPRISPAEAQRLSYVDTVAIYGAVHSFLG